MQSCVTTPQFQSFFNQIMFLANGSAPPAPPLPNMSKGAPPPPPIAGLKLGSAPPLGNLNGAGKAIPGPPAPLGAPILTGLNVKTPVGPKLPSYLKPKQDKMAELPTRKLAGWENDQVRKCFRISVPNFFA